MSLVSDNYDMLIARIAELEAERRWVPCEELPPERIGGGESVRLLVISPEWQELILFGRYVHCLNEWRIEGSNYPAVVTFWRPLPEPPPVSSGVVAGNLTGKGGEA